MSDNFCPHCGAKNLNPEADPYARVFGLEADPLADVKAAHKAGNVIQTRLDANDTWDDELSPAFDGTVQYRIKPEPRVVPLGPEDVPPGSAIKGTGYDWLQGDYRDCFMTVVEVTPEGCWLNRHRSAFDWKSLQRDWFIHRPGDNDADGKPIWRKCEKEEA